MHSYTCFKRLTLLVILTLIYLFMILTAATDLLAIEIRYIDMSIRKDTKNFPYHHGTA